MVSKEELKRELAEEERNIGALGKNLRRNLYRDLAEAKAKDVPIAHMSGLGPTEIFSAMGILPLPVENLATICASKKMALRFVDAVVERGFAGTLCSYARCGLGMMYLGDGPYGPLAEPDVIIAFPQLCDPHAKWWEVEAHYYNAPLFRFDGAYNFYGKHEQYELDWTVTEIKRLIAFLEQHTKARFDYDRFKEAMILSGKALELFCEINEYRKAIPCPRTLRETLLDLFMIVALQGKPESVDYMTRARDHVEKMVENKIGILPEEKFRLCYDMFPVFYSLQMFDYLAERGAAVVVDPYTTQNWQGSYLTGIRFDPEKPFESLALRILYHSQHWGWESKLRMFERLLTEWHCDGLVQVLLRGCKEWSMGLVDKARIARDKYNLPVMTFEAEQVDPASVSEAELKAKMDTLLETLEGRKKRKSAE